MITITVANGMGIQKYTHTKHILLLLMCNVFLFKNLVNEIENVKDKNDKNKGCSNKASIKHFKIPMCLYFDNEYSCKW